MRNKNICFFMVVILITLTGLSLACDSKDPASLNNEAEEPMFSENEIPENEIDKAIESISPEETVKTFIDVANNDEDQAGIYTDNPAVIDGLRLDIMEEVSITPEDVFIEDNKAVVNTVYEQSFVGGSTEEYRAFYLIKEGENWIITDMQRGKTDNVTPE